MGFPEFRILIETCLMTFKNIFQHKHKRTNTQNNTSTKTQDEN